MSPNILSDSTSAGGLVGGLTKTVGGVVGGVGGNLPVVGGALKVRKYKHVTMSWLTCMKGGR